MTGRQTTPCGCPEEALIRSHVEGCPWFTAFVEAGRDTTVCRHCGDPIVVAADGNWTHDYGHSRLYSCQHTVPYGQVAEPSPPARKATPDE